MSLLRPFNANDLFSFNNINLDAWTETYAVSYYLSNMAAWPDLFSVQESADGTLMGYVMGKTEGEAKDWHGHVTAITVAPDYRRLGLAKSLMQLLEKVSDLQRAYFVDLFVRVSNNLAIAMYEGMGYCVYRTVAGYYAGGVKEGEEDAYDMRICCSRDTQKESIANGGRNKIVQPEDCFW